MTDLSRRSLLATGALGAALSPFVGGEAAAASKPRVAYSRARFLPHRRKRFRMRGPGGRWTARLLEITDLSTAQRGDDQAFGLVFRFQRRGPEQASVTIRRRRFAPLQLFLVPTDARRRTYYAVVNRSS
jgi:hypothetical protein